MNITELDGLTCFPPFNSETFQVNVWSGQAFAVKLLLFGYWDLYPGPKIALLTLSVLSCVLSLITIFVFGWKIHTNKLKVTLWENPNSNVLPWWKNVILPFTVLLWQFAIGIVYITGAQTAFSITTAEAIFVQGIVEDFALLTIILLTVRSNINWKNTLKIGLSAVAFLFFFQLLFASSGNPFVEGMIGLFSTIGDVGNPIATIVYLSKKGSSVQIIFTLFLFISHVITFYIPVALCNLNSISSLLMPIFAGTNFLVLLLYCVGLLTRWNGEGLPALF